MRFYAVSPGSAEYVVAQENMVAHAQRRLRANGGAPRGDCALHLLYNCMSLATLIHDDGAEPKFTTHRE